jgi:hypothetical protein
VFLVLGALLYSGTAAPVNSAPADVSLLQEVERGTRRRKNGWFKNFGGGFSDRWKKSEEKKKFLDFFDKVQENVKNSREEIERHVQQQIEQLVADTSQLYNTVLSDTRNWGTEMASLRDQLKSGAESTHRLLKAKWEQLQANTTLARSEALKQLTDLGATKAADVLRIQVKELEELAKKATGWLNATLSSHRGQIDAKIAKIKAFVESGGSARAESLVEVMDVLSERYGQIEALMDDPSQWFTWGAIPGLREQLKAVKEQLKLLKEAMLIKAQERAEAALLSRDALIAKRAELEQRLKDIEEAMKTAQGEVHGKLLVEKDILLEQIESLQGRIANSSAVIHDRIGSSIKKLESVVADLKNDLADVEEQLAKAGFLNLDLKGKLNEARRELNAWRQKLEQSVADMTATLDDIRTSDGDLLDQLGRIQASIHACLVCSVGTASTECTLSVGRQCTEQELTQLRSQQEKLEAQIATARQAIRDRWAAVDANMMAVGQDILIHLGEVRQKFEDDKDDIKALSAAQLATWGLRVENLWDTIGTHSSNLPAVIGRGADELAEELGELYTQIANMTASALREGLEARVQILEARYNRLRAAMAAAATTGQNRLAGINRILSSFAGQLVELKRECESTGFGCLATSNRDYWKEAAKKLRTSLSNAWTIQAGNSTQMSEHVQRMKAEFAKRIAELTQQLQMENTGSDLALKIQEELLQFNMTKRLARLRGAVRAHWSKTWTELEGVRAKVDGTIDQFSEMYADAKAQLRVDLGTARSKLAGVKAKIVELSSGAKVAAGGVVSTADKWAKDLATKLDAVRADLTGKATESTARLIDAAIRELQALSRMLREGVNSSPRGPLAFFELTLESVLTTLPTLLGGLYAAVVKDGTLHDSLDSAIFEGEEALKSATQVLRDLEMYIAKQIAEIVEGFKDASQSAAQVLRAEDKSSAVFLTRRLGNNINAKRVGDNAGDILHYSRVCAGLISAAPYEPLVTASAANDAGISAIAAMQDTDADLSPLAEGTEETFSELGEVEPFEDDLSSWDDDAASPRKYMGLFMVLLIMIVCGAGACMVLLVMAVQKRKANPGEMPGGVEMSGVR